MRTASLVAAISLVFLWQCSSTVVEKEKLYVVRIPWRKGAFPGRSGKIPAFIVGGFKGRGFAMGSRLWARVSESTVEPWIRHKWALPIPELVRMAIYQWAKDTGWFEHAGLGIIGLGKKAWILQGTVISFEEVEKEKVWEGHVEVSLELHEMDGKNVRTIWRDTLEESVPARARNPDCVVDALGEALGRILSRASSSWPWPR